jgi:hypothetical protein
LCRQGCLKDGRLVASSSNAMHFPYLKIVFVSIFFIALFGFTLYLRYREKNSEQLQKRGHAVTPNKEEQVISNTILSLFQFIY